MIKRTKMTVPEPTLERRDFIKTAAAAAVIAYLKAESTGAQGEPWWDSHPSKEGVGAPISIDVHSHWAPEAYLKAVAELGHPVKNPYPLSFDLDKRRKWMDEHGVRMHILTLDGEAPWQWASGEVGMHLARIVNDAAIEAHTAFPDRFTAAIVAPIRDPMLTLKEINRVAGKPGIKALQLPDSIERHDYLFEPDFAPVFARCEELVYPIIFHQIGGPTNAFGGSRDSGPPDLLPALDAPTEHGAMASKFIVSGILDRFPKLEIVLPHAGGTFPYLAGRVDHFLYHMGGAQVTLAHPFKDYLRRFHYDYLTYYPEAFRFLISLVGTDRIVMGTDGFAAKDIEYPNAVLDQFNLSKVDRDRILRANAVKLFNM
jgi:aminocarboxymuconate-semialdehyde decarboxylase